MLQSPLIPAFDKRTHASYEVRVRGTMYLWGSAGLTISPSFSAPLLLHIRNNVFGEVAQIGTVTPAQVASDTSTSYGTIQPGESVTLPIDNICGVFATCALETTIDCLIQAA
ncbi:MAG: hypothetical protein WBW87_02110 [Candidatus Cybelea sp.]